MRSLNKTIKVGLRQSFDARLVVQLGSIKRASNNALHLDSNDEKLDVLVKGCKRLGAERM